MTSTTRKSAAVALAVGATLAGVFAAPAQAGPGMYVALSYSFQSGVSGVAVNPDMNTARINSLQVCQDNLGNHCVAFAVELDTCAALAILGVQEHNVATGATRKDAENQALAQNPGSEIAVSGCSTDRPWKNPLTVPQQPLETFLEPL